MHFQMAAMYILKGTIKCNVINHGIAQKKDCSFRIYQNLKITHADPDHLFLAITQNWAMRLFVGFVMQGHIYSVGCVYICTLMGYCVKLYYPLWGILCARWCVQNFKKCVKIHTLPEKVLRGISWRPNYWW